jgi:ADP-heptose:LPS heptosyltransferase
MLNTNKQLNIIKKILVMQLGPFGDVLLTTSYFEHLKKRFPKAKIIYLTKKKYQIIVKDHPYIDNFILLEVSKRGLPYIIERIHTILKIRKERFDIIIDQQNKNSTKQFVLFSNAKIKIGYRDSTYSFIYNLKVERGPICYSPSRKFDMVNPLGISLDPYKLYYYISENSRKYISEWLLKNKLKQIFVLSPGSPVAWKKWDIKRYAESADLISRELNLIPVWLWGPSEEEDVKKGHDLMKEKSFLAPKTSLNQAAALLEKALLFICNDGGINHLAVTTGVKTIAVFGATEPEIWSPAGDFSTHYHLYNKDHNSKNDNSFGISPEEVFSLAKKVIHA